MNTRLRLLSSSLLLAAVSACPALVRAAEPAVTVVQLDATTENPTGWTGFKGADLSPELLKLEGGLLTLSTGANPSGAAAYVFPKPITLPLDTRFLLRFRLKADTVTDMSQGFRFGLVSYAGGPLAAGADKGWFVGISTGNAKPGMHITQDAGTDAPPTLLDGKDLTGRASTKGIYSLAAGQWYDCQLSMRAVTKENKFYIRATITDASGAQATYFLSQPLEASNPPVFGSFMFLARASDTTVRLEKVLAQFER